MTILAVHPPHIELRREEFFSRCEIAAHQQLQHEQQLEFEDIALNSPVSSSSSSSSCCSDDNDNDCKTVRFSLAPKTVHEYLSRQDITDDEKANAFMTYSDLVSIRHDMQRTRHLIDTNDATDDDDDDASIDNLEYTSRGVEIRQRKLVRTCRAVVLQEQHRHNSYYSPSNETTTQLLIATRYSLCNQSAAVAARDRGQRDYEEVTNMYLPARLEKEARQGYGYYNDDTDEDDTDNSVSSNDDDNNSCDCE